MSPLFNLLILCLICCVATAATQSCELEQTWFARLVCREVSSLQDLVSLYPKLASLRLSSVTIRNTGTELSIGEDISLLHRLRVLNLNVPRLELLSGGFSNLPNLLERNISGCGLEQLQLSHFATNSTIGVPDVSHNKLSVLPVDLLSNFRHLAYANFSHNSLSHLEVPHIPYLLGLELGHNKLASFSIRDCPELKELNLNDNQLTQLNAWMLQRLPDLTELQLSGNLITNIGENTFQSLIKLRTLNLSRNALTALPANVFGSSTEQIFALQQLDLSQNNINVLFENQFEMLGGLQMLDLSGNKIATLKNAYFAGLHLQKLCVGHNLLAEMSNDVLESLKNITDLLIDNNQLTFLSNLNVSIEGKVLA